MCIVHNTSPPPPWRKSLSPGSPVHHSTLLKNSERFLVRSLQLTGGSTQLGKFAKSGASCAAPSPHPTYSLLHNRPRLARVGFGWLGVEDCPGNMCGAYPPVTAPISSQKLLIPAHKSSRRATGAQPALRRDTHLVKILNREPTLALQQQTPCIDHKHCLVNRDQPCQGLVV